MNNEEKWEELRTQELQILDQLEETEKKRYKAQQLAEDWQEYYFQANQLNQDLANVFYGTRYAYVMEASFEDVKTYSAKVDEHYERIIQDYRKQENKLTDELDILAYKKRKLLDEEGETW